MGSFLRIDGEEAPLNAGRLTWYPAVSDHERGLAVHLAAHGPRSLLHVAVFVPGVTPSDLSSREATVVEAGPDAAVDGRMFGALLLRFGRVDGERAVLSLDGEVEGILSGSEARSQVAADISCSVEAGEVPTFCQRCGASLAGEARIVGQMIGGRYVELRRPLPVCRACASEPGLEPSRALLAVRRDLRPGPGRVAVGRARARLHVHVLERAHAVGPQHAPVPRHLI